MKSRQVISFAVFLLMTAGARANDNPPPEVLKNLDFFEHLELVQDPDFLKSHGVAANEVTPSSATIRTVKEGKS